MLTVHLKEDNPLPEGLVEEMHKAAHEESNRDWRDWLRGARWAVRRLLEDRKDAARYRWLQEHTAATGLSRWMGSEQFLSEAVDKAIANSKTPNVAGNRLAEGKSELTGLLGGPSRSEKE